MNTNETDGLNPDAETTMSDGTTSDRAAAVAERRKRVAELTAQGVPVGEIAGMFNISVTTVQNDLKIVERDRPPAARARRVLPGGWLGADDVATELGISRSTVWRMCQAKQIRHALVRGLYKFKQEWVDEYLKQHTVVPVAPERGPTDRAAPLPKPDAPRKPAATPNPPPEFRRFGGRRYIPHGPCVDEPDHRSWPPPEITMSGKGEAGPTLGELRARMERLRLERDRWGRLAEALERAALLKTRAVAVAKEPAEQNRRKNGD